MILTEHQRHREKQYYSCTTVNIYCIYIVPRSQNCQDGCWSTETYNLMSREFTLTLKWFVFVLVACLLYALLILLLILCLLLFVCYFFKRRSLVLVPHTLTWPWLEAVEEPKHNSISIFPTCLHVFNTSSSQPYSYLACLSFPCPACEHFKLSPTATRRRWEGLLPWRRSDAQSSEAGVISNSGTCEQSYIWSHEAHSGNKIDWIWTYTHTDRRGLPFSLASPCRSATPWSDDDDEDDEPTLLCISSTQWLMVCLHTVDGSCSYLTLLLAFAAV